MDSESVEAAGYPGPITRTAADAGAVLAAIAGRDVDDPTTSAAPVPDYLANLDAPLDDLRIGIDPDYNDTGADAHTIDVVHAAGRVLEARGARIREVRLPSPDPSISTGLASCAAEAAIAHQATYPARRNEYGGLARLLDVGRSATGMDVMRAQQARLAFRGALVNVFDHVDVLLTPTQPPDNPTIARIDELWATPEGTALMWRFTEPFNMSGNPCLTVPGGCTPEGLPLAFQLVGRHFDEAALIRAGHAYQRVTGWHTRHPIG